MQGHSVYDRVHGGREMNDRRRYHRFAISILSILAVAVPGPTVSARVQVELTAADRALYDSLSKSEFSDGDCHPVKPGARWETPLGELEFLEGRIAFLPRVMGRTTGCYFEGRARFFFWPEAPIERKQLERYTGKTTIDTVIERAYIRFFDPDYADGLLACTDTSLRSSVEGANRARRFVKNALDDLTLDLAAQCWAGIADGGAARRWLYLCPEIPGERRLHFMIDDSEEEAVSVWRPPAGITGTGYVDLVCSYDPSEDRPDSLRRESRVRGGFDIKHYDSHVKISGSAKMDLTVTMNCRMRNAGQSVLSLALAPDLKIEGMRIGDTTASYLYSDDGGWLLARSPQGGITTDTFTVQIVYRGNRLMDKLPWGDFFIHHTTQWLPRVTARQRATYRTQFRFPKHYDLVSVGRLVSDSTGNRHRVMVWETYGPEAYISFNYGSFERLTHTMGDGVELEVYRGKNHLDGLFSEDFKKRVARELEIVMHLYNNLFSPYPWDHLAVTEIPGSHGQGFPQLLHLAWVSFDVQRRGVTDLFLAHEVAHQWFGHIVGWRTYHDQWLSEGFADYAGALYVQARHAGNEDFFKILKDWRERILTRGGYGFWHDGPDVAPIWLGFRCASYHSPASYNNLVYSKGAYVLHMLRQAMYDYDNDTDSRFFTLLRVYVDRFAGQEAGTEDFQRLVEEFTGEPMDWFFNQWVYGTGIPRFEYRWSRDTLPDGRWVVRGRIDQIEPDPPFRVDMPVTIVTEMGRRTTLISIGGALTEFESAPLETRPTEVIFNDFYTVLCREKLIEHP